MHLRSGSSLMQPKVTSQGHRAPSPGILAADGSENRAGASRLALSLSSETEGRAHLDTVLNCEQ